MDGYDRSVADVASRLGVVQDCQAQFPTLSIRKNQRAEVTARYAEEIRGKALDQTAKVELGGHAVRNFQQQVQPVALMSQFAFKALPFALVLAQPLFRLLPGVNVCSCSEPPQILSRLVWQRVDPAEKPAKRAVVTPEPRLKLSCLPRRHHLSPGLQHSRQVVRMHGSLPASTSCLF